MMNPHLTDDQLDDLLLGDAGPEAEQHFAACTSCRERSAVFSSSLSAFNQASMAYAQARANSLPLHVQPSANGFRFLPTSAWAFVALLLVALTVLFATSSSRHLAAPLEADVMLASPASPDSPTQIASDNAMLASIDSALDQQDPSPLALYAPARDASHPMAAK